MEISEIRSLEPRLNQFLHNFDDCFVDDRTRSHLRTYVQGQLSDLPRKSVEPIALRANTPPRTLQEFLSLLRWDEGLMRDRLEEHVARKHPSEHSVGVIDDTGCPKKGNKTPGVQSQWCGASGKVDNCIVTVHLSYAADAFHCLLDGELFLPESWNKDRQRCRKAGIPDSMVYRPKWKIALELYDKAIANGVRLHWLTFDQWYTNKPGFLHELTQRQQYYVGDAPELMSGWIDEPPAVTRRPYRRSVYGRPRKTPRLLARTKRCQSIAWHLLHSEAFQNQAWTPYRIREGTQGPMVWEAKHAFFYPKGDDGLPLNRHHLIVARNVLNPKELKYFISNAPEQTTLETLLLVGFTRWTVERCFEDEKMELGFDHFEGRHYQGLKRHQCITAVSHLFLAETKIDLTKKKSRDNVEPTPFGFKLPDSIVVAWAGCGSETDAEGIKSNQAISKEQCQITEKSPTKNTKKTA